MRNRKRKGELLQLMGDDKYIPRRRLERVLVLSTGVITSNKSTTNNNTMMCISSMISSIVTITSTITITMIIIIISSSSSCSARTSGARTCVADRHHYQ